MDNRNYDGIKWYKNENGYWRNMKYGYQHVYVWEQAHQATVDSPYDVIHHLNEDKEDNRIENLQLMSQEEHTRLHAMGREHTLKTRSRISATHRGMIHTAATRVKLSAAKISAGLSSANTSGYRGVSWFKRDQKWQAGIKVNNKSINLGHYSTPEEAANAYDTAARKYFGDDAFQNFPTKIIPSGRYSLHHS